MSFRELIALNDTPLRGNVSCLKVIGFMLAGVFALGTVCGVVNAIKGPTPSDLADQQRKFAAESALDKCWIDHFEKARRAFPDTFKNSTWKTANYNMVTLATSANEQATFEVCKAAARFDAMTPQEQADRAGQLLGLR
jgi:hypothetical protein